MKTMLFCLALLVIPSLLDADALDDALAKLEKKIEAEKARYERELGRLRAERDSLRKDVAELEDELAALRKRGRELADEQRRFSEEKRLRKRRVEELKSILSGIDERVRSAAKVFSAVLETGIPPADSGVVERRLKTVAEGGEEALSALLGAHEAFFDSAASVELEEGEVVCADGRTRKVELLCFGVLGRIYRSRDGVWKGIALTSPDAPQGWEYANNPPRLSNAIDEAFEQVKGGEPYIRLPVDPTGKVVVQRETERVSFWEQVRRGGVVMVPIGVVALIAFLLIVLKFFSLRKSIVFSPPIEKVLEGFAKDGRSVVVRLSKSRSATERVFAAVLRKYPARTEVLEEVLADAVSVERTLLERFMGAIGVCGTVAPLLGLLGTVTGMIRTFETITAFGAGDPRFLAGGIREALLTTEAGLIVAIPVLLLHSFLSGRLERMAAEMEHKGGELIASLAEKGVDADSE